MPELPEELTAENGAKAALIGEFFVQVEIPCACGGDGCKLCDNEGYQLYDAPIPWTTIKDIYRAIKEHFVKQQFNDLYERSRAGEKNDAKRA